MDHAKHLKKEKKKKVSNKRRIALASVYSKMKGGK